MPKAIVCDCEESVFSGDITVSTGTIIHPRVNIIAKTGPIIIGENCLIEEYATIIHDTGVPSEAALEKPPVLVIGANNVFEVGCTVEALKIGERNTFECKSYVSSEVKVSNNCVIGAGCRLESEHELPENTIVHGKGCEQREAIEKSAVSLAKSHRHIAQCIDDVFLIFKFTVTHLAIGLSSQSTTQLSLDSKANVRSEENQK